MSNRRGFAQMIACGVGTGVAAGAIGTRVTKSSPNLRVIGNEDSMLVAFDTGQMRLVIALGERNDDLLSNIAALGTMGSTRIDLAILTHRAAATHAARNALKLDTTQTLVLQTSASLPPIRGLISSVFNRAELDLGDGFTATVEIGASSEAADDHPDFVVDIRKNAVTLALAHNLSSLRLASWSRPDALILPGELSEKAAASMISGIVIAGLPLERTDPPQVGVFWNEPTVLGIESRGLRLRED